MYPDCKEISALDLRVGNVARKVSLVYSCLLLLISLVTGLFIIDENNIVAVLVAIIFIYTAHIT